MEFSGMNLEALAMEQGGHFLSDSLSRTWVSLPSFFAPCSGDSLPSTKRQERSKGNTAQLRQPDFTGRLSVILFYLACFGAVWGHMRFSNHEALPRPDFPLEWHTIRPSNVAIINSCLGSSNCFELYTIWINQYEINKALLFCNPLLKLAVVISGDIVFPCLAFGYAKEHFFHTSIGHFY